MSLNSQLLWVEAASKLAAEGLAFQLILLGDGPLRPERKTLIKHHGLENQVKIVGWASGDAVQKYIIDSRGLVLPSFSEGLPVDDTSCIVFDRQDRLMNS